MKAFTRPGRLSSAYGFDFLYADRLTPALVRAAAERWPDAPGMGWPSWAFENHDAPRALSRWTDPAHAAAFARMKILLLGCLRGNIFLYYGEELGLTQVDIPFDQLRDPEAIANWPLTLSRDGARTPMPWTAQGPALGFSAAAPWLPVGADHAGRSVERQERDPGSLLHYTRHVLALRQAQDALLVGEMNVIEATETLLVFERRCGDERLLCAFNFTEEPVEWVPPDLAAWHVIEATHGTGWRLDGIGGWVAERRW